MKSQQKPYTIKQIQCKKLGFEKIKSASEGTIKTSEVFYNDAVKGKQRFLFQTPELYNKLKPVNRGQYSQLELQLIGPDMDKISKFITFLNDVDNIVATHIGSNIDDFNNGEDIGYETIIHQNEKEIPTPSDNFIKIKIWKDTRITEEGKSINVDEIQENSYIKMILEGIMVWTRNNEAGILFKPILIDQHRIKQVLNTSEISFVEDSDGYDQMIMTEVMPTRNIKKNIELNNYKFVNSCALSMEIHDGDNSPKTEKQSEKYSEKQSEKYSEKQIEPQIIKQQLIEEKKEVSETNDKLSEEKIHEETDDNLFVTSEYPHKLRKDLDSIDSSSDE